MCCPWRMVPSVRCKGLRMNILHSKNHNARRVAAAKSPLRKMDSTHSTSRGK